MLFFISVSGCPQDLGKTQDDDYNWYKYNKMIMIDTEHHCLDRGATGRDRERAQRRKTVSQTQDKREKADKYDNEIGEKQISWMCSGYYSFEAYGHLVKCFVSNSLTGY